MDEMSNTMRHRRIFCRVWGGLGERSEFHGCYGGFLFSKNNKELEKAVVPNEELPAKASVLLKKRSKRVSNFKSAVLLLTHGAMYKTWWARCEDALIPITATL